MLDRRGERGSEEVLSTSFDELRDEVLLVIIGAEAQRWESSSATVPFRDDHRSHISSANPNMILETVRTAGIASPAIF